MRERWCTQHGRDVRPEGARRREARELAIDQRAHRHRQRIAAGASACGDLASQHGHCTLARKRLLCFWPLLLRLGSEQYCDELVKLIYGSL
eukprot:672451-Pleurochrysis_carterae.AAC.1